MHVEYDMTEQDFLHALQLVHRRTTPSVVRWFELAPPFLGFAFLIFTIYRLATEDMSGLFVLGLGVGLYLLFVHLHDVAGSTFIPFLQALGEPAFRGRGRLDLRRVLVRAVRKSRGEQFR
jgi:hypothetical protein